MDALILTDGTTTVAFTTAPHAVLEYVPAVAKAGAGVVADKLKAALAGDTLALALGQRDVVDRLLAQAARVSAGSCGQGGSAEARVYLQAQRAADLPVYRSEVMGGAVAELDIDGYWPRRGCVRAVVALERRAYWEAPEVELGLLSGLDYLTGGKQVHQEWGYNHVDLAAIGGDLPAPLRLLLRNDAGGHSIARIYAGLRCASSVGGFVHMLEGEDSYAIGAPQASAHASGGTYQVVSWNNALEFKVASWSMNGLQLEKAGGRWYRLVARFVGSPNYADLALQVRVVLGSAVLWAGPWVKPSSAHELCELGNLLLPPGDYPYAASQPLTVALYGVGTGALQVNLDYLAFLGLDGLRRYEDLSTGLAAACDFLMDDPSGGQLYAMIGGGLGGVGSWLAAGDALYVRPGYQHRLVLQWEDPAGLAWADRTAVVQLWYRPRVVAP